MPRTEADLLQCCAVVVASANYLRKEAIAQGDEAQRCTMLGRVEAINLLAAMLGLGVQRVHDLAAGEEARVRLALRKAA